MNAYVKLAVFESRKEAEKISRERTDKVASCEKFSSQPATEAARGGGWPVEGRHDGAALVRQADANVRFGHVVDAPNDEGDLELAIARQQPQLGGTLGGGVDERIVSVAIDRNDMSPPQLCFEFPRTRMDGCYGNPRDWAAPTVDSGLQVVSPFDTSVARKCARLARGRGW